MMEMRQMDKNKVALIANLVAIRDYMARVGQSNVKYIDRKTANMLCDKLSEIDPIIIELIMSGILAKKEEK